MNFLLINPAAIFQYVPHNPQFFIKHMGLLTQETITPPLQNNVECNRDENFVHKAFFKQPTLDGMEGGQRAFHGTTYK